MKRNNQTIVNRHVTYVRVARVAPPENYVSAKHCVLRRDATFTEGVVDDLFDVSFVLLAHDYDRSTCDGSRRPTSKPGEDSLFPGEVIHLINTAKESYLGNNPGR